MKFFRFFTVLILAGLLIAFSITPVSARPFRRVKNLYSRAQNNKPVTVYIGPVNDEHGENLLSPEILKKAIEKYMAQRRTENFQMKNDPSEADLLVEINILKYRYLEDDPVDQITGGITGIIVDAAVKQPYADVTAEISVTDKKKGKVVWEKQLPASITETGMTPEDAPEKVSHILAKQFVFRCFGKPKRQ